MPQWLVRLRERQVVRPWALCAPVVVLVIALPLLRPLRWPGVMSENEMSRLATVEALVERGTLAINDTGFFKTLQVLPPQPAASAADASSARILPAGALYRTPTEAPPGTIKVHNRYYSDKPPVMALLLSWAYQGLHRLGWDFEHNPALVAYVLTMLGVTLPVAGAAGLLYRMARAFELRRPLRTALALAVVLGSGLIGYATVLNPHAPAAALIICTCACFLYVAAAKVPTSTGAWLVIAGLCASLAAVIDLSAAVFLVLLFPVVLVMRWSWSLRLSGALLYIVGAAPPILLHAILNIPVTGDLLPGYLHPELSAADGAAVPAMLSTAAGTLDDPEEPVAQPAPWKIAVWRILDRSMAAMFGAKGLLTHWPVVIVGLMGMWLVLRRHWPATTKLMAAATLAGSVAIVAVYTGSRADWGQAMFGPRWFIVFLPIALFWSGAWLRRSHRRWSWGLAGTLLAFSIAVSLIGGSATPFVHYPPGQYTVVAALKKLTSPAPAPTRPPTQHVRVEEAEPRT